MPSDQLNLNQSREKGSEEGESERRARVESERSGTWEGKSEAVREEEGGVVVGRGERKREERETPWR